MHSQGPGELGITSLWWHDNTLNDIFPSQSLKDEFLLVHGHDRVPQMWPWPRCRFLEKRISSSETLSANIEAQGDSLPVSDHVHRCTHISNNTMSLAVRRS